MTDKEIEFWKSERIDAVRCYLLAKVESDENPDSALALADKDYADAWMDSFSYIYRNLYDKDLDTHLGLREELDKLVEEILGEKKLIEEVWEDKANASV
jgi:hypothetical protein